MVAAARAEVTVVEARAAARAEEARAEEAMGVVVMVVAETVVVERVGAARAVARAAVAERAAAARAVAARAVAVRVAVRVAGVEQLAGRNSLAHEAVGRAARRGRRRRGEARVARAAGAVQRGGGALPLTTVRPHAGDGGDRPSRRGHGLLYGIRRRARARHREAKAALRRTGV